jgi:carbamate kinase
VRVVVALGGNAILQRGERGTASEQRAAVRDACEGLADLAAEGNQLVVTHGNGPQVGALMLQQQAAEPLVPAMPLDVLVAQTQGQLGYLMQQELTGALRRRGIDAAVVSVVTQVLVDPADPAFVRPTKPVGPYLSAEQARELKRASVPVTEVPGGAWRRVVPSPAPREIVERDAIRALVEAGVVPIAAGGGGAPVVAEGSGFRGIEGVVDKDLTAALLAAATDAGALVILTDVDRVIIDRGTRKERAVSKLTVAEACAALEAGQFPRGSMGPKMDAAVQAVREGRRAVICSLSDAARSLSGAGTEIVA